MNREQIEKALIIAIALEHQQRMEEESYHGAEEIEELQIEGKILWEGTFGD